MEVQYFTSKSSFDNEAAGIRNGRECRYAETFFKNFRVAGGFQPRVVSGARTGLEVVNARTCGKKYQRTHQVNLLVFMIPTRMEDRKSSCGRTRYPFTRKRNVGRRHKFPWSPQCETGAPKLRDPPNPFSVPT